MSLRIQSFLTGVFALIAAFLLALAPASANPASGGYQLFEQAASGHQTDIQLASLGNFNYHAKTASECCTAPNRGELPSSYTRNADGSISGPGNLSGQQAVFRETGEVTADGGAILQRESGGYYSIDANGNQQYIPVADLPTNLQARGDAPWQQSQTYIQDQVGGGEISYLNGVEVPHGTPGSVRPDAVPNCTQCFEVKNYDLSSTSGQNSLVTTTVDQINTRATHLPDGMQQNISIDITGQNVSIATQAQIRADIVRGSNGAVDPDSIDFFVRP